MQSIKNESMQQMVNGSLATASKPESKDAMLNKDAFARIGNLVNGFIEAENRLFEGDTLMATCALGLAKHFGTNPSYDYWEATRKSWLASYMARLQNANDESSQKAWERLAKRMAKECMLEKPKAPSKDANRMSAKRAEEQSKLEKLTDSQLVEMMAEFKAVDNFKEAEKLQKEVARRAKVAGKGVGVAVKAIQSDIKTRVGKVTDLALLKKIQALLPKSV